MLREQVKEKSDMYQQEMANYLWDELEIDVSRQTIGRSLQAGKWSKKKIRRVAKERNEELRDFYSHKVSRLKSSQFIFVDESGSDQHGTFRRTGWAPHGVTPIQHSTFHRDPRHQILPAYAQDGIMLARVYQGTTDAAFFEDFIEQLLCHCGRFPEPKSVLVMDNAPFHRTHKIRERCQDAGVLLIYLPPYSPDLNPIEEFFAELKAFIKKHWHDFEDYAHEDFGSFLKWCVDVVGKRKESAEGHFRHSGIDIVDLC